MKLLRQVRLAQNTAVPLVGDIGAEDVAHDVALILLGWEWQTWSDRAVVSLAQDFAEAEIEHNARYILMADPLKMSPQ